MNIVEIFEETAQQKSSHLALIDKERRFSFARLSGEVDRQACRLSKLGFGPGDHCLLLMKNSAEFVASVFALFKIGVVPILIDPGMGLGRFLKVIEEVKPDALLGVPRAFALRKVSPKAFRNVVKSACWGHFPDVADLRRGGGAMSAEIVPTKPEDMAAVLFTSGSTGPAKGVVYSHQIFCKQIEVLRTVYRFTSGDVDLPGFPLFGLFSAALGVTGVVPTLDPSRPASCRASDLVAQIQRYGVTSLQGSPAIWKRVAQECLTRKLTLPTVKRIITFGAPISFGFLKDWQSIAPFAKIHTPYGATEALPLTDIEATEILETRQQRNHGGAGLCVGKPLDLNELRIIDPHSGSEKNSATSLALGEIGEVAVRGPVVTQRYFRKPEATAASKIPSAKGVWHRMGDLGYFDEHGRIWLVGRKSHAMALDDGRMLYPLPGESLVLPHPEVERAALVEGRTGPVLIVERTQKSRTSGSILRQECLSLLHQVDAYQIVKAVLFHPSLPVDPRHNAKIHREELSEWAKRTKN